MLKKYFKLSAMLMVVGVLQACSSVNKSPTPTQSDALNVSQKLVYAERFLALSSYTQVAAIFTSFSQEEEAYLWQHSLDYLRLKGVFLTQTKQLEKAKKHYQLALEKYSNDTVLLNNYGVFLLSAGDLNRACDYFEKAVIQSDENSFSGLINLSRCELSAKKVDKAVNYLKRAKEINNLPYIGLLTELNLALILGDLMRARQSHNKIQAEQKIAPYIEHKNEYECLLQQYNAAELDVTFYSSTRPFFACVFQGIKYGIRNSRKQ